jgi:hypothetical protein
LLLTRLATVFTGATYAATGSVIGATTVGADLRLRAANTQVTGYSERTLASTAELLATAAQVGSLFPDTTQDSYLRNLAIGALSQPVSRSQAADLLRRGLDQGRLLTSSIAIETSGRFTVPGNTVELPFTVVNDSELSVTVGIKLVADNPTRLRADPVPVVTVESGQRVVVQLPISITGVGTVTAAAQIVTADGITVGAPVRISVTSTAGQRFARNLVWLAFATLVLLAANSWRKRREAP